jgi:hypothetical protein
VHHVGTARNIRLLLPRKVTINLFLIQHSLSGYTSLKSPARRKGFFSDFSRSQPHDFLFSACGLFFLPGQTLHVFDFPEVRAFFLIINTRTGPALNKDPLAGMTVLPVTIIRFSDNHDRRVF